MNVLLTLDSNMGADLGPNFNLSADVGLVVPNTATKSELTAGLVVAVDDLATIITVTSLGVCTNSLELAITNLPVTTTTTTTIFSELPEGVYPAGYVQDTGYCWFTRNKAVYVESINKTFVGQVHSSSVDGHTQHIITINNANRAITKTRVGDVYFKDDHNEPSILVRSSDSKLFTAYCGHDADFLIRYRVSINALDASSWGNESTFDSGANVTYPSCFEAANGDIYIFYRQHPNWCYIKSTDGGVTFGGKTTIYSGISGVGGYLIFAQSPANKNIIHALASGGHPALQSNVSSFGFYFDCSTNKLYKLDETETTANIPLDAASDMTAIMSNTDPNVGWIEDITVDSNGYPRYLLTYYPNGKNTNYLTKDLYYAEWNGSAVTTPAKIHTAAAKSMGAELEPAYMPNSCFHAGNPNIIIASKEVSEICEIHKITRISPTIFVTEQITSGNAYDQWRPFVTQATENNAYWLNKKAYPYFTTFVQSLRIGTIDTTEAEAPVTTTTTTSEVTTTTTTAISTLKTNLLSLYEFDETTGTVAEDAHSTNDGTISGATINQTGKIVKCYDFDGVNDSVSNPLTAHYTNFSFAAWIYVHSSGGGTNGRIMDKRNAGGTNAMWIYCADFDSDIRIRVGVGFTSNGDWGITTKMTKNAWHHLVVTYNNSSTANNPSIYIDSVAKTVARDAVPSGTLVTNTSKYWIGNRGDGDRAFDGLIDQVGMWDKILTQEEVTALYNAGNGLPYTSW